MEYLRFIQENRRFLGFGFLLAALSGYGQTYLISVFGGEIRAALEITNGQFGAVYSLATLASGVSLIWLGRLVDHLDLRVFTAAVLIGAALGAAGLAMAGGIVALGIALYLLRLCGQGLMTHIAQTSMARYFHERRGTAISVATLGLPLAEALFPATAVAAVAALGWRWTWGVMAVVMPLVVLPRLVAAPGHGQRRRDYQLWEAAEGAAADGGSRHWSRREVLRDPRFYGVVPAVMGAAVHHHCAIPPSGAPRGGQGLVPGLAGKQFPGLRCHTRGLAVPGRAVGGPLRWSAVAAVLPHPVGPGTGGAAHHRQHLGGAAVSRYRRS
ncbi:MAG: MFS transporter [Arhodomonas sp.]|nr:MFS transporter [Arhodomonas sp.]